MDRSGTVRRIATAAAYGSGGLGALSGGLYGLLRLQATWARRAIGPAEGVPPSPDGWYGTDLPGQAASLLLLGDSAAAGYGMTSSLDTPGALLGQGLAAITERPIQVTCRAFVGARSADLDGQVEAALRTSPTPDVAIIVIGTNDVTHSVRPAQAVGHLADVVRRLRAVDCDIVVGTCPDLGTIGHVGPPLRQLARMLSRRMAAAQTVTVVEAGGRSVSLGQLLSPSFAASPGQLFGADRFHPSLDGYASMVAALLPSVAAALGAWDGDEDTVTDLIGASVLPISSAATQAAEVAGTEVSSAQGPGGRWARLRRRQRAAVPQPLAPDGKSPG